MTRILIVEDNLNLLRGLHDLLAREGYDVATASDGPSALSRIEQGSPDLMVLDLMLPEVGGARVLRAVRSAGHQMPVLVLTARSEEDQKVRLLDLGADDYVTKPFGRRELTARIAALLRRSTRVDGTTERREPSLWCVGTIVIDRQAREVTRNGMAVELAPKEFDLLVALALRGGGVATRRELLDEVWRYDPTVITRTVDLHVFELRRKLEADPARPEMLLTARKIGYRLRMDLEPPPGRHIGGG